jgi:type II secretory pathway component PulF
LVKQTGNRYFVSIIKDLVARLEQGESFSSAISNYPNVFNKVYVASIQAAESSGKFEEIIEGLADQEAKEYKFASAVRAAIAYPVFIIAAIIVASIILLIVVVPKLESVFTETHLTLPWSTAALIATANFFASYGWLVLLVIVFLAVWFKFFFMKSEQGKEFYGRLLIHIPVFKDLFIGLYMVRFAGTLSMLVKAGVSIISTVKIVGKVIGNPVYEQILNGVASQLERGVPMSVPLSQADEFPPVVPQMVAIGEQTGKLDEVMSSLADLFEDETNKKVAILTSLIEPILLVIVGLGVGTIVFAIIIPIYQISSQIQ